DFAGLDAVKNAAHHVFEKFLDAAFAFETATGFGKPPANATFVERNAGAVVECDVQPGPRRHFLIDRSTQGPQFGTFGTVNDVATGDAEVAVPHHRHFDEVLHLLDVDAGLGAGEGGDFLEDLLVHAADVGADVGIEHLVVRQ